MSVAEVLEPAVRTPDSEVPWWAIGLLDLEGNTRPWRTRRMRYKGVWPHTGEWDALLAEEWEGLVGRARREWGRYTDAADALAHAERDADLMKRLRHAALRDPRAFCQLCDIRDDDQQPMVLKDFHVRAIRAMRTYDEAIILLPASHGKSQLSSILVPLLDWSENPESTQIRIYYDQETGKEWARKLMYLVESNDELHRMFPHVDRPRAGDPCHGIWGTNQFSIRGKQIVDPSWRTFTVYGKRVGKRADRVGADDWVSEANCSSDIIQGKLRSYWNTGPGTMKRVRTTWGSPYSTIWGTLFLVGTIFDRRDINNFLYRSYLDRIHGGDRRKKVIRIPVYPRKGSRERGEVIWPEARPFAKIRDWEEDLGPRAFRMRFMNAPTDDQDTVFTEEDVKRALCENLAYGLKPSGVRLLIGYDPAVGARTKYRKYPAAVLLGHNPTTQELHFIRYERWSIPQPDQIRTLVDWARTYDCPVVVESNNIQASYEEWIKERDPWVRVINHYTHGKIKHDHADGVESFLPLFRQDLVRIHTGQAERKTVNDLVDEFVNWPQGKYFDMVMAAWFAKYQFKLQDQRTDRVSAQVPNYVAARGVRRMIDLSRYR